jgi:hypothetical protein
MFATGSNPDSVLAADFNGDGNIDLAIVNTSQNTVSVFLNMTPPGANIVSLMMPQTFAVGRFPVSLAVADFNGDGKPDLAATNIYGTGTVSVLLNTTAPGANIASFADPQNFASGEFPASVATADFNGDGKPDLAIVNRQTKSNVSVLLNTRQPLALRGSPASGVIQDDDAPMSMTIGSGNNQSTSINTVFAVPLMVEVRNAAGSLVQGVSVTFTAPANGPSGTFASHKRSATIVTDATGRATAPAFMANAVAGSYAVQAQATGGSNPSTTFSLTNLSALGATNFGNTTPLFSRASSASNVLAANTSNNDTISDDSFGPLVPHGLWRAYRCADDVNLKMAGSQTISVEDRANSALALSKMLLSVPNLDRTSLDRFFSIV